MGDEDEEAAGRCGCKEATGMMNDEDEEAVGCCGCKEATGMMNDLTVLSGVGVGEAPRAPGAGGAEEGPEEED